MDNISLMKITKNTYKKKLTDDLLQIYMEQRIKFEQFHNKLAKKMYFPTEMTDNYDVKKSCKEELLDSLKSDQVILYFITMFDLQEVIGFIIVRKRHWYDGDPKKPVIENIYIDPQYQKSNLGKIILMKIFADLEHSLHPSYIALSVYSNNDVAISTYNSMGFYTIFRQMFIMSTDIQYYPSSQLETIVIDKSNIDKYSNNNFIKFIKNLLQSVAKQYKQLYPTMLLKHFKNYYSIKNFNRIISSNKNNKSNKTIDSFAVLVRQINKSNTRSIGILLFVSFPSKEFSTFRLVDIIPLKYDNIELLKEIFSSGLKSLFARSPNTICTCNVPITHLYTMRYIALKQLGFHELLKHMVCKIK